MRHLLLFSLIFLSFTFAHFSSAAMIDLSGFAWSENIGWIKFKDARYGVRIDDVTGAISGYAWSSNLGYLDFSYANFDKNNNTFSGEARICSAYQNEASCSGPLKNNLGGFEGRLKLSGANYGIRRSLNITTGCSLSGYAWGGDVVGWVSFRGNNYRVNMGGDCPVEPEPTIETEKGITCDFEATPSILVYPRSSATLTWVCSGARACSISGLGAVRKDEGSRNVSITTTTTFTLSCTNKSRSFSTDATIRLVRPTYCEIIPNGPGCPR
ncbi:MAG: hypothetical protein FJY91_02805 [Candidatus Harrisonbacteria bacterium]|nr:hypothetical protein [Candidatus Harrisonbacteria bacterium]